MLTIKQIPDGGVFSVDFVGLDATPETPEPHRHEYFEIFWTLAGEGRHSIDFVQYEMKAGRMFFISPGQVHDVDDLPDALYAISFNAEFINAQQSSQTSIEQLFLQHQTQPPYIDLDHKGSENLKGVMRIIDQELERQNPDNNLMSHLLVSLLRYVMRYLTCQTSLDNKTDNRMIRLLKLMDEHYVQRRDTGFYSDKLAITSKRLNELTREKFSKTVTQMLHDKVTVEARRLLVFSDKTIKSIAFQLGYQDTSYFCRFFKRQSGMTPAEFRANWHNQHPKALL